MDTVGRAARWGIVWALLPATVACQRAEASEEAAPAQPTEPVAPNVVDVPVATLQPAPKPKAKPPRPAQPLNVLLITVDSLRADMPWAGYERDIAPNLTKLAKQSVVYETMRSASSYTAQSVATFLSGRYASTLYRNGWFFTGYADGNEFFTEAITKRGVRTIGVHAHMYFNRGKGLEQGFDVWQMVPGITFDPKTDNHVTSEKHVAELKKALSDQENVRGQFFAWAHFMDPHDKYVKHAGSPDFGSGDRDRYDNEVHHTDEHIGKFLDWAKQQAWWRNTALIVTSDHGEAFGEHGRYRHAGDVWDVLVRVPMLVHAPGITPRTITEARSHVDLAPTIADLMRCDPLDSFQGKSLVPELYGAKPDSREPIIVELAADSVNPPRRAVISGGYKLTVYGTGERAPRKLFHVAEDPGEKQNLAKSEPEKLAELEKVYDDAFGKLPVVAPYGGMALKGGGSADGPRGPEVAAR